MCLVWCMAKSELLTHSYCKEGSLSPRRGRMGLHSCLLFLTVFAVFLGLSRLQQNADGLIVKIFAASESKIV